MVQVQETESERSSIGISVSEKFRAAIEAYRDANGYKTNTKVGQIALAQLIGYDLANEPEPKGRNRYGTDESGKVDREYAKLRSQYKSTQQNRWLLDGQKARRAKDYETMERMDTRVDEMEDKDWEPVDEYGRPDWAKRIEIREKAIANLRKAKDAKDRLPDDYEDDTLEEWRGTQNLISAVFPGSETK